MHFTHDPFTMPFEEVEKLNLKITNEIKFILDVEYNLDSPRMSQALLNLNLRPEDLEHKQFELFQQQDEDVTFTFQRFYYHLHQIANLKKQLVKERNRIKREEIELSKSEQKQLSKYSHTEYTTTFQPEDPLMQIDRKLELKKINQERSENRLRNRIRDQLEEELRMYSFNQIKKQQQIMKIDKSKKNSLKEISDRAHRFNERTQQILKQQQSKEQYKIVNAIKKQQEQFENENQKYRDVMKLKSKLIEEQKEKEQIIQQKQKQAELRVLKIKQQEIRKCDQLLQQIQSKMQKSTLNRKPIYSTHSARNSNVSRSIQSIKEDQQQQLITNYIVKHNKKIIRNSNATSQKNINISKRLQSRQINTRNATKDIQSYINYDDQQNQSRRRSVNIIPIKHQKSKSVLELEQLRIQQNQKKLERNSTEKLLFRQQLKLKQDLLRQASQTQYQLKDYEHSMLDNINKIKQNVSKQEMLKQIEKWNIPELVDKYLK